MYLGLSALNICKTQVPGAPPFNPSSVAALTNAYDASQLSTEFASSVSGGAASAGNPVGQINSFLGRGGAITTADAGRCLLENVGNLWYWDDSAQLLSQADGGGSTTGFYIGCAFHMTNAFGTQTMYSEEASLGGLTGYDLSYIAAQDQYVFSSGNGTVRTSVTCQTLVGGTGSTHVIMAWDDGTNLNIQLDNNTIYTTARATVSAGVAAPYWRCQGNVSTQNQWFGYNYAWCTAKNGVPSLSDRNSLRTWLGQKAGLSL